MKRASEPKQPIKTWKIVVGVITLGIFAFMGFVIGDWLGLILGIVIWVALYAALGTGQNISTIIEAQKRKIAKEDKSSALEILEQRYALGEIDKIEYEEKKRELTAI